MRLAAIDTWRHLNPKLAIAGSSLSPMPAALAIEPGGTAAFRERFDREGYCQLPGLNLHGAAPLADAIQVLVAAGLPPVFVYVYDEAWQVFARLGQIVEAILGAPSGQLPEFWAWCVDPARQESGWRPHRDRGHAALFPDRRPKSLTVWLPLTAATPLNGCMYVVPALWDPVYGTERDSAHFFDFRSVRALPADAGDVLIWNHALLHWGSRASGAASQPRISMAFEFQRRDVPLERGALLATDAVPPYEQRLTLIARQIHQYRHMYGEMDAESVAFAEAWATRDAGGGTVVLPGSDGARADAKGEAGAQLA